MAFPRSFVIQRVRYTDYPLELVLCRTMTTTERTAALTGATVTLTVNDIAVQGTITSVTAGTVTFEIPDTISTLAANVSPGYDASVRVVDGQGYTRDVAEGSWLQMAGSSSTDVTITGTDGATLAEGDIITGEAALRAVSAQNDRVRFTYELPSGAEPGAGHMWIMHDGEWRRCFDPNYGDWSFFAVPLATTADRIVVLESSGDAVEISIEWTALALNIPYLSNNGIVERNSAMLVAYNSGSVIPRYITTIHLRKLVRIERGRQGYYVGWHSSPHVGPDLALLPGTVGAVRNNESNFGEREIGTGTGVVVAFSSTENVAYFPAWRSQRDWSAVLTAIPSFDNFAWWPGLDDPTYGSWANAAVIAMQPTGFPAEQATGPWWCADIPASNFGGYANLTRYIVQKNPNELGVWCYAGQNGIMVNHFTNAWRESDGRPTKFQLFIGAEQYEADATAAAVSGYTGTVAYANEPSDALLTTIAARAASALEGWPE